ncbi:MAG: hypothetical protein J5887_00475 [Erysipelotrichaceae bacterium]|nr:hypothetical protein [Erysipelotrichaceae bacterium]
MNESDFGMQFYLIAHEEETPEQPGEQTYGFTNTLETGDKVIILNREYNKALSSAIVSNFYLTGTDLTPVEGVRTTDKTDVVWEVTKNADGTYLFTQDTKVLGGIQATDNNNNIVHDFVFTDAQATKWTVDKTVNGTQLYLGELPSNKNGHVYLEWDARTSKLHYALFDFDNPGADTRFIYAFYKQGAEAEPEVPADPGDLVTDLSQLTDGAKVAIYSPKYSTAISTKPNGDWYLRANNCTVVSGKVVNFTSDFVWTVKVNEDGSYSFISNDNPDHSLTVWPSGNYAEVTVEYDKHTEDGDNTWKLDPAKTANCWYFSNMTVAHQTKGKAYLEAIYKNYANLFSGWFTEGPGEEGDYALQFYLVDPNDAVPPYDDGTHDGILTKGEQYIIYNPHAGKSLGLYKAANYAMDAIDTEIRNNLAYPGNGAYVVTVDDTLGRYYTFTVNGRYLVTNTKEELLFIDKPEDGTVPEEAKWYLVHENKDGFEGYFIFNKECRYNGYPVCIEYFSSVFSGWTYNKNNKLGIYLFKFYKLGTDVEVREDIVQAPAVIFDCWDSRCIEQNFPVTIALDDLAEDIAEIRIKYLTGVNGDVLKEVTASDYEVSSDKKTYSFTIAAEDIDGEQAPESFKIIVEVKNSYDIEYSGEKTVVIEDKPFFEDMTPAPNAQTRDDKRPVISVKVGNVGDNPKFEMTLNEVPVEAVFNNGILSYQASEDMEDGLTTVYVKCTRADEVSSDKSWNFTVGVSDFQLYFGQLHSHTTYSDGSGDLTDALEYIASLPASANVQFVAFTDHSNYFDSESAYNPAAAMNDASLMQEASRDLWNEYRDKIAAFNNKHTDLLAIAGYEMTWSGGPGHINSYNTNGLVSRNNPQLDNKSGDAGMKLYYETIKEGENTLHQFNHPGNTFGNFSDFAYWDEKIDSYMFLVEVGNGEGQIGSGGYYPSYEQYILALDNGWHLAPTNNQDNHKGRWGNANDARDVVLTNDFSVEGIYDAIRNLRVYATEDKNLQIGYTVNEQPMGTIFDDNNKVGEKMNVLVTLFDPDAKDSITKVELVRDGGVTAYTWTDEEEIAGGILTVELAPEYCYYFVRVTQADGDLAVTAPIWTRSAYKVGIQSLSTDAEDDKVYTNEEFALTATLYNNEDQNAKVTSVTFTIDGNVVLGSVTDEKVLPAGGTVSISLDSVKLTDAKLVKITATAIVEIDGKQYTYTKDLSLEVTDKENENKITPISEVRAASDPEDTGYIFNIEGVVSSNASGYDKATAFFDCIYVQDATGGICCFPVSGQFKVGDKVRIHGYTDFYQGEPELQVLNIEIIEKLETPYELETTEITSEQLNDRSAEGMLITLKGTVESYELVNGLVQTIMVRDAEGNLGRVFIDGYITKENEVENLEVGGSIEVTGLASYDDSFAGPFPRIRVRDRADVVCDHLWGDVDYIWSNDNTTCTAIRVCQANGEHQETETVSCQVTVIEPTATEDGRIIYTATFQNPAFEKQEKEVKGDPATGQVGAEYTVDTGADSTWIKGSEENLLIVVHRSEDDASTFGHFVRIEVDGNIVAPDSYEAEPGSLKATVKAEYLETLEEGGHEVKVVFDDGKAETTLTIATEASGGTTPVTPDTGDYSHLGLYIMVMAVSLMMELALYCSLKRRQDRAVS